jgi:hypothetical protein
MRGHRTSPEKIEEIRALSVAFDQKTISQKTGVPLRTVYAILAKVAKRSDGPALEAARDEKRREMVDRVWDKAIEDVTEEVATLKGKERMLLENLTPEKAAKARVTEISTAYGTLFDKRRLLEKKSTENVAHQVTFVVVDQDGRRERVGGETDTKETMSAPESGQEGDQAES